METYVTLLSGLFNTILGRFSYIGSNLESYPLVVYILGVSVCIEAVILLNRLMKGE